MKLPKGTKDISPEEKIAKNSTIEVLKRTFRDYGMFSFNFYFLLTIYYLSLTTY